MQIHYALFDQATDMGGGNYWTWADKELPHELLTRFYNDFAVKHLAPEPNKLGKGLWGGIVHLASESLEQCGWLVLYREFDGGHDRQNRPNRFVILTAWIRTNSVYENLMPIFDNDSFRSIFVHSKELPVPQLPELLEDTGATLMRVAFEKFVPFVNPSWDSHLQIENKPSGMDTTESDAFVRELDVRFKAERLETKRIKDELNGKLQQTEELMRIKELEWESHKERFNSIVNEKSTIIKSQDAEIKDLRQRAESRGQIFWCGVLITAIVLLVPAILLLLTGDIKMKFDGHLGNLPKILFSKTGEHEIPKR